MEDEFKEYLKEVKFDKHFSRLKKKFKNKSIIIYGTGKLFQFIKDNYNISSLNIIGISDKKFSPEEEGEMHLGYKIIPKDKIPKYNPDYVIVAALEYSEIIEDFYHTEFNRSKIKIIPLVKIPILKLLEKIWSKN
ncbi:MAG: hypothetical protein PHX18_02905 [Candidatus Gastranaerophilales bacterium]|nr:hypothetical protein [Candidatus Gastranaerophilales bacterium]